MNEDWKRGGWVKENVHLKLIWQAIKMLSIKVIKTETPNSST